MSDNNSAVNAKQKKKLILVTSPPACGKTFISKKLAQALTNCVYLDKDTLIVLSKQIFKVAGEEYNRSSDFFQREIRDYEYYAVLDLAFDALDYNDTVLINAPFTDEIRDDDYLDRLRHKLEEKDAVLCVIWVHTDVEVAHQRMIRRNSDRDVWKLEHWDEYIATQNFTKPGNIPELFVFNNSSEEDFKKSLDDAVKYIRG
jgi:predicted kinase